MDLAYRYPTENKTGHLFHIFADSIYDDLRSRAVFLSALESMSTKWAQINYLFVAKSKAVNAERSHAMTAHTNYAKHHQQCALCGVCGRQVWLKIALMMKHYF